MFFLPTLLHSKKICGTRPQINILYGEKGVSQKPVSFTILNVLLSPAYLRLSRNWSLSIIIINLATPF